MHTAAQQLVPKYVIVMIGPDAQVKNPMSSALNNSIATSFLLLYGPGTGLVISREACDRQLDVVAHLSLPAMQAPRHDKVLLHGQTSSAASQSLVSGRTPSILYFSEDFHIEAIYSGQSSVSLGRLLEINENRKSAEGGMFVP